MKTYLKILSERGTLSEQEAEAAMHQLMRGEATPEEIAGFLMALRSRGETLDELVGLTKVMREYAIEVNCSDPNAIDMCGTGGDHTNTFNISTTVAFVCAGAGVTVAKHGNRSVSSQSGSADVLEALGINTQLRKAGVEYCLEKVGMAFIFAPFFHPCLRHVMPVRKALGVRTFFNILGPLCNPARVKRQLVGAFDLETAKMMANILQRLGAEKFITVHAKDGLDELSTTTTSSLFVSQTDLNEKVVKPEDFGLTRVTPEALVGGNATYNASILLDVLNGQKGAPREVVLLNATHALWVSGKVDAIETAFEMATESIDSGKALATLNLLKKASQEAPQN